MYELKTSITINNVNYKIRNNADYRVILDVISACDDTDLTSEERGIVALIIFYEDINSIDDVYEKFGDYVETAVNEMLKFIAVSDDAGCKTKHKLIDWVQDEQLIVSAINDVARTEIRALNYLHWWTFISYYMAIGECSLSTVVGIRDKINKGKKLEKYEQEFRRENPQYFTWKSDLEESQNLLAQIWNRNGE